MKKKFINNPRATSFYMIVSVLFLVMVITMIVIQRYWSAVIFGILALIYMAIALYYSVKLEIDRQGIRRYILSKEIDFTPLDNIKEIGVCGTKVFNYGKKKKTGTLYIYFSEDILNEDERFRMILEWPPKKGVHFMLYTGERALFVQNIWEKPLAKYNTGDLIIGQDV